MTVLTNNAAGGTNGVAVTTGNSGGASGDPFNGVTLSGAGASIVFDNAHSTMAYKYTTGTSSSAFGYTDWIVAGHNVSGSFDLYLTANPLADHTLVQVAWSDGTTTTNLHLRVTAAGKLLLFDGNAAHTKFTTTNSVPLNTWCKVTFAFHTFNDPSGSYDVRLYPDLVTATPTETQSGAATWTSYGDAFDLLWGSCNTWKNPTTGAILGSGSYWMGNLTATSAPTLTFVGDGETLAATDADYLRPIPAISSIGPPQSSTLGGAFISLHGFGLNDTTAVIVAGDSLPFTIGDENLITFYSQVHAPGLYDVTIHNPYGDYTLVDSFEFVVPAAEAADITGMRLPFTLPAELPGGALGDGAGLYTPSGPRYNYAVGGLPFLSAASTENPLVRETVPIRKQQYDTANVPGEQSLEGWWLRSQQSFHGGAGQDYADPTGSAYNIDSSPLTRFKASRNVDVWTPGKVTLLNSIETHTELAGAVDVTEVVFGDGYPGVIAVHSNGTYSRVWGLGVTKHAINTLTGSFELQTVTSDGAYVYAAGPDAVWSAPIPYHRSDNLVWTKIYTIALGAPVHLGYVKQRIMLGSGPNVYELVPHPTSPPVAVASPKYTAADPTWRWCSFTESGPAIYAVGNNGARGSILKFVLAADGSIPVLSGAAVAAQLPAGEVPYSALGYLGSFVGLGTSKGARVAVADSSGDLTYGPLIFTTTEPVRCWTARDRFLFCAVTGTIDGQSGVCRIDLATQVADLRFAYATDLNSLADTSTCRAVANFGDEIVFGTDEAMYLEDDRTLATSGYLLTSRVRFGTLEPKLFKRVKVRGPALVGAISFQVLDEGDHPAGSYTYRLGRSPGETEAAITSPSTPQDFVSLKFTLQTGTAGGGGEFWGYQLMALPGAQRQRMIQLPVWCFDWERDGKGQRRGATGSAFQRLSQLEALEKAGSAVVFQDLDNRINTNCVIEQVSFKQTTPPEYMDGLGGIVTLTLRTV